MRYLFRELPLFFIGLLTAILPDHPIFCRIRGFLARPFFKKCGKNFQFGSRVRFMRPSDIEIGNDVFVAEGCWFNGIGGLILHDEVMFGPRCIILTSHHTFINNSVRFGPGKQAPITIGRGTWLAAHVVVKAGVTIGSGNLIAANTVVIESTPDNVLVSGVPGKIFKTR